MGHRRAGQPGVRIDATAPDGHSLYYSQELLSGILCRVYSILPAIGIEIGGLSLFFSVDMNDCRLRRRFRQMTDVGFIWYNFYQRISLALTTTLYVIGLGRLQKNYTVAN